jgi:hypothetical protein
MCCGTSSVAIASCAGPTSTYLGTDDDGQDVYTLPNGNYVNQDGDPLTPVGAITTDSGAAFQAPSATATPSQSTLHTAAPAATANSGSQGGVGTSGLTGIFSAIGSAFGTAVNPPKTVAGVNLVWNPATGTYVPAGGTGATATSNLTTYLVIGAVAVALLFVIMAETK